MTATYMDRPSKRIWCAIEGVEALSTDAAEAALMEFETGEDDFADDEIEEDGADEQPDVIEDADYDADDGDDAEPVDEELDEADPAESDAEDDPEEEDDEGGDEEDDEPELVIEAPQFWDADGKEVFAKLEETLKAAPPELRPIVASLAEQVNKNEKQRNITLSRKLEETATVRKVAEQAAEKLDGFISETDTKLERYKNGDLGEALAYYRGIDWVRESQISDPDTVRQHQVKFRALEDEFQALKDAKAKAITAKTETEQREFQQFAQTRYAELKERAPQFLDPKTGPALDKRVTEYLSQTGYTPDMLMGASANDLIVAEKAMLWDEAQAKAKKATKPKPVAGKARRKGLKPSAAKPPASSKQALRKKINSSGGLSTDDAVSALLALE